MPDTLPEEDQSRIEALAILFGIGFVLFDVNTVEPNYRVCVRAQRFSPDMFDVNEFADRLHDHNRSMFNRLFQQRIHEPVTTALPAHPTTCKTAVNQPCDATRDRPVRLSWSIQCPPPRCPRASLSTLYPRRP
ncbi:MAG: hypothetical protein JNG88_11290 [Phycisphaerales bacterium]|nr:hypothetical protein [Phycisphaerales bacterium]